LKQVLKEQPLDLKRFVIVVVVLLAGLGLLVLSHLFYLAFTVMLAAALDGIEKNLTPPPALNNINLYHLNPDDRTKYGVQELPGSLSEALMELEKDTVLRAALGEQTYEAFSRAKWAEWDDYRMTVTDFEIQRYLETA